MSSTAVNLEIQGDFAAHSFAELLAEAATAELSGSLRLAHEAEKIVVYVRRGAVVFAVSNARRHRLFERLLQANLIQKQILAEIPNFTNDLEFGQALVRKDIFSKATVDDELSKQIGDILHEVFAWNAGEWIFSPLARIREEIAFAIDTPKTMIEIARRLTETDIAERVRSYEEIFEAAAHPPELDLLPAEAFVFSRFETAPLRIRDVLTLSGLPDAEVLRNLYALWFGGFLKRRCWNSAFTESQITAINAARLTVKKEEPAPAPPARRRLEPLAANAAEQSAPVKTAPEDGAPLSVEEYLENVETAENYYEMLDLPLDAALADIKTAYFAFAKSFHPDKFHQELNSALQQRVQKAFSDLAKAYETLKTKETREIYDFKLRKSLEMEAATAKKPAPPTLTDEDRAKEEFEQGLTLLTDGEANEAAPFLARAVQFAPRNARYHAYYAKALSADEKQRFKADGEFQIALRLDPQNAAHRLLLAEFYVRYNLTKRAIGELQRLLAIAPNNKEARALLDTLTNK